MFGSITGSIVSFVILFMFLWKRKEWKVIAPEKGMIKRNLPDVKQMVKELTFQGFTIALSGMLMVFMQLADSLNLYSLLTESGIDKELAKSLKGIYDRGQPLIQLGTVAAASISLSLVPLITRERLSARRELLQQKIQSALKVSIVIGIGASAGLWAVITPTNIMLFKDASGSDVLGVLSFVILFTSIIAAVTGIMQGLGNLTAPALAAVSVFPIKYMFNMVLIPVLGMMGAAVSSLLALFAVSVFLFIRLKRIVNISLRFLNITILAALVMVVFLKGYLYLIESLMHLLVSARLRAAVEALSAVGLGGILFLWAVIKGRVFDVEELALFPFGSKIIYFIKRKERDDE